MLVLLACVCLCLAMFHVLRGGLVSTTGTTIVGMDMEGIALAGLALLLAAVYLGPLYGIAICLSIAIHEFGHVAAYRIAGHADARFRLIPLMGGVAISDRRPDSDAHDFFITLMGPGICLAPMAVAFVGADMLWAYMPMVADFLWTFAIVTGALNFLNLLPFWPLDGGRCVRLLSNTFMPGASFYVAMAMSAGFAAVAISLQSMALTFFAVMGAQSLLMNAEESSNLPRMNKPQGLTAATAYIATMLAHLWGGWAMIVWAL